VFFLERDPADVEQVTGFEIDILLASRKLQTRMERALSSLKLILAIFEQSLRAEILAFKLRMSCLGQALCLL
jgi:hypothetical protein